MKLSKEERKQLEKDLEGTGESIYSYLKSIEEYENNDLGLSGQHTS